MVDARGFSLLYAPGVCETTPGALHGVRRASRGGEARARRRQAERRASHHEAWEARGALLLPRVAPGGPSSRRRA